MDVKNILLEYKQRIDSALSSYFLEKDKEVSEYPEIAKSIFEDIKEYTLRGGKRVRSTLVIHGYKAFGGLDDDEILKAALAVELMQSFLLVHDDIIDNDSLRRGKPTLHKIYESRFDNITDSSTKLGESIAIVAGDIMSVLGNEILQKTNFPIERKLEAIRIFNKACITTCIGQIMDTLSSHEPDFSKDDIKYVQQMKTATYTLEAPLHLGATLAGASSEDLKKLSDFAIPLGEAFQIQDDILGMFGTEEKIGKPVGSDLQEGKKTLLIMIALEKSNDEEKEFLELVLGKEDVTELDILKAKTIIEETGSLKYSQDKALELIEKSKQALGKLDIDESTKEFFEGVAEYMLKRKY